jgi:demethylmenaquinone methyltransferase/2-methoxy-6-polyprenyl-1,4-benzoquinol methylase
VLTADALQLPFANASFDGATVSFGLRNVSDLARALSEILRILRPGGWLGVLEFGLPRTPLLGPLYRFYFERILPRLGEWISGDPEAYRYLPASVAGFPQGPEFVKEMEQTGFQQAAFSRLTGGILYLYLGRKAL